MSPETKAPSLVFTKNPYVKEVHARNHGLIGTIYRPFRTHEWIYRPNEWSILHEVEAREIADKLRELNEHNTEDRT